MPKSTAKPDFTFEAGKSYYTYDKKLTVTVNKRSACYVSVVGENGETLRRKILTYTDTISTGDGKVCEAIYLHEHVNVSARDLVQQEYSQPDTASASQPAVVVSTECETSAQPERTCSRGYFLGTRYKTFFDKIAFISRFIDIDTFLLTVQQDNTLTTCTANYSWKKGIAFIAGDKRNDFLSAYRLIEAGMPSNVKFEVGKTYGGKYKITARTDDTISYSVAGENLTGEAIILNIYDNFPTNNHHGDEYFYPSFSGLSCECIYARDISPDTPPEDSQPETLYDDDSFSDAPGDNSDTARNQDFPVDIPECTLAENHDFTIIPADEAVILRESEHSPAMDIPPEDIIRQPYFPPEKFTTIWASDLGSGSFAYKIAKKDYTLNYVVRLVNSGYEENSNCRKWTGEKLLMFYNCNADSSRPFACYSPMLGIFNFSHSSEIFFNKFNNQQNFINHFMPALNDFLRPTDLLDNNGEIISDGLEAFRYLFSKATILDRSCRDDNFTMPENPFTNDNDKDNPLSWRESPYRVKALRIMHTIIYTTVDATRVWNWDKSAVKKLNKRIQALTAELHKLFDAQNVSMPADNTVHACNIPAHNTAAAVVPYNQAASIRKFFHIIALYFRLWLAMNISRRDIAISMPVIIPATVNDITPQQPTKKKCATASAHDDIEHKLIDTKDLHFAEKRKALDHNAAVITSCMFPEAVISLLMSISAKAILQLGSHMRLFIAKPKGTKKVIAELFANRLIDSRKSRANVRTKSGNFTAKSTANIPDGVKFFVGAKRQICFKFDDPQLDLPFDD